jgi:hypothetical protein
MRLSKRQITVALLTALSLLGAIGQAAAEPVTLTSGGIFYSRQNAAVFDASSLTGIGVRGEFGSESESWDPPHACFGCTPGTRIDLSLSESFTNDPSDTVFAGGAVRVDDVNYWFDSLDFRINGGHINLPDSTGNPNVSVDAGRFVFHGMITGTSDAGVTRTFRFHGKGIVSMVFGNNQWFGTSYRFSDASAAAVPEPGTMLLFGSGAVGALVRRKRQRQQS